MSLASVTVQQNNALAAANAAAAGLNAAAASGGAAGASGSATGAAGAASGSSPTGANALTSLSSNFNDFLQLLMTQLKNQDPSSPLDTNQFTSELVQFSGVEQQINTNSSLTQLIQLTQAGDLIQGSSMLGSQVQVSSNQIPLQNGTGTVQFTTPAAEPVAIAIYNASGQQIYDGALNSTAGANSWTWNGSDSSGNQVPDGAYKIAVIGANPDGSTAAIPFTVGGTVTGVQNQSTGVQLQLGGLAVPFSSVQSLNKG